MLASNLKMLRENRKISQRELSKAIGCSASTVGMYETGRRAPDYETLKKISKLFNVSIDYLLGNDSIESDFSLDEMNLICAYRQLPSDKQSLVCSMIRAMQSWEEEV